MTGQQQDPHEFTPDDVKYLSLLAEKVAEVAEWYGGRLVVTVYDRADTREVAWIEHYPSDSHPTLTFAGPIRHEEATDDDD